MSFNDFVQKMPDITKYSFTKIELFVNTAVIFEKFSTIDFLKSFHNIGHACGDCKVLKNCIQAADCSLGIPAASANTFVCSC